MSIFNGLPLIENELAFQIRYIEESIKMGEARILELKRLIPSEYTCIQESFDRRLLICILNREAQKRMIDKLIKQLQLFSRPLKD